MKTLNFDSLKKTEFGKTYWNNEGAYNAEYSRMYDELVPAEGCAETFHGELLRAISRLSYEYFNNGNCNARVVDVQTVEYECSTCRGTGYIYDDEEEVECPDCGGSGYDYVEEETEPIINNFYRTFMHLLAEMNIIEVHDTLAKMEELILYSPDSFTKDNENVYTYMTDLVMFYILNTEDSDIPEWYKVEMQHLQ